MLSVRDTEPVREIPRNDCGYSQGLSHIPSQSIYTGVEPCSPSVFPRKRSDVDASLNWTMVPVPVPRGGLAVTSLLALSVLFSCAGMLSATSGSQSAPKLGRPDSQSIARSLPY